jgi:hypothetical protein
MNIVQFKDTKGNVDKYVNLEKVESATPYGKDQVMLKTPTSSFAVDKKQFEEAISKKSDDIDKLTAISRNIINALDRLSVHIPTSIRLHM